MGNFEVLIVVLTLLIALLAIADRFRLPHPVFLVLCGLGVAFIPFIPAVTLNPDVVFFIFLPPILYDAASNTSWHDFKAEARPISTLAIALVFFTTAAVSICTHFLIPGFPWPLAFVLGAIVSPPDAVAATSITKGLGLNRRVITILEGESLVNDASALIAYRFAISAIGAGSFIFWQAGLNFLLIACGGIVMGLATGYLAVGVHKKVLNNSMISTSLTLITPFIAYLAAERLHVSGVLAVVTTGMMMSWRAPEIYSYQTRIRSKAVWETVIFLLNSFIFILIGLQLRQIVGDLQMYSVGQLFVYGLIVSLVTIAVRILWVFTAAFSPLVRGSKGDPNTWKNVMVVAWTGTRGIVSLATALALPLTLADGSTFPNRSLILFLAFVVIFATLVVQGLSLPLLIRFLGIKNNDNADEEERDLRVHMATQVANFIDADFPYEINDDLKSQLKSRYLHLIEMSSHVNDRLGSVSKQSSPGISSFLKAQAEIQKFERKLLIQFHKEGAFNQSTLRRAEQELDLAELQLKRINRGRNSLSGRHSNRAGNRAD